MRISFNVLATTFLINLFNLGCNNPQPKHLKSEEINWKPFNREIFNEAKEANKLVFLEVGANWCHWCHVMDDSTYSNTAVKDYLNEHFILSREDQDARPDLFSAYKPWGWPALIVFNADGEELLKLKGYQPAKRFLADLKNIVNNPTPLPPTAATSTQATLVSADNRALNEEFRSRLDYKLGGFPHNNRALELSGIEHALQYKSTENKLEEWAKLTVQQSYLLVDPVWSGVYQYSAKSSWDHQHYEKLLRYQANYIESYCRYGIIMNDTIAIQKAEEILNYCKRFLQEGTPLYWNSQNADLIAGEHSGEYYALNEAERLIQGTPSVDKKIYLKENAMITNAMIWLWAATDNEAYLKEGQKMLDYSLDWFKTANGLYAREKGATKIYSFEDNRRLIESLMLYGQVLNEKYYIDLAEKLATICIKKFNSEKGIQSVIGEVALKAPIVSRDNLAAVMTYNRLSYLCDRPDFHVFAKKTFDLLDQESLKTSLFTLPELIRARHELESEPFHAKLVGGKQVQNLKNKYMKKMLMAKNPYFIFEELVPGKMSPEDESFYGGFDAGTLFMCTSNYCSAPIRSENELINFLEDQDE